MLKHMAPISCIASSQNKYVATAGYDNRVILWDAKNKSPLTVGIHDHLANYCEFSSCGNFLVTGSSDHTARLWLIPQMKLLAVFNHHNDDVECAAIHPTEFLVATASRDKKVRVFDFTGRLLKIMGGHQADVISVQWLGEGREIVSSSDDGTIRVWDSRAGVQINQLNDGEVQTDALAISQEGVVFSGDDSGKIHAFFNKKHEVIQAHHAGIKKLVFNDSLKKLISVSYDRKAKLWNFLPDGNLKISCEFVLPNIIWPRSCAFNSSNEIIFATFGDAYATYNYKDFHWQLDHINNTEGINALLVDRQDVWTVGDAGLVKKNKIPDRQLSSLCNFLIKVEDNIITGGQSGEIFTVETGEVVYHHHSPLNCAAYFSNDNNSGVIVGTYTGEGLVFKKNKDGKIEFSHEIKLHDNAIKGLAVSNNILFSICATGAAAWHNIIDNKEIKFSHSAHSKIANGCVALENGCFASISRDLMLRIWDENFLLKFELNTPHTHSIKCITVDENFNYIATGSYNGMIAIYNIKKLCWCVSRVTTSGISSIIFDKNTNQFLASSYDGSVYPLRLEL